MPVIYDPLTGGLRSGATTAGDVAKAGVIPDFPGKPIFNFAKTGKTTVDAPITDVSFCENSAGWLSFGAGANYTTEAFPVAAPNGHPQAAPHRAAFSLPQARWGLNRDNTIKQYLVPIAATVAIGLAGLGLIQDSEGLRLKVYRDSVGVPTVCWGHTGPDVRMGETWTRARCEAVFQADVAKTEKALSRCVFRQLNPYQSGALVSLAYNVGTARISSCSLRYA